MEDNDLPTSPYDLLSQNINGPSTAIYLTDCCYTTIETPELDLFDRYIVYQFDYNLMKQMVSQQDYENSTVRYILEDYFYAGEWIYSKNEGDIIYADTAMDNIIP